MIAQSNTHVAFIDDDPDVRAANVQSLQLAGFDVLPFARPEDALAMLTPEFPGVIVSDIRMPGMDGFAFFRHIQQLDPTLPVIFITGHADVSDAVSALQSGAYDFIAKPYQVERLVSSVRRGLEQRALVLDNRSLRAAMSAAESTSIQSVRSTLRQLAEADVDVLIEGETGVGKDLAARLIHAESRRRLAPFVTLNCASIPDTAIAAELLGEAHRRQGEVKPRIGRIEAADRGILLLDDIDLASPALQSVLARFIDDRTITPVGGEQPRAFNGRVIATARAHVADMVATGAFRADLFYGLSMVRVRMPPLRDRRVDIGGLFAAFLADASRRTGRPAPVLTDRVRQHLLEHDWPGNVRELQKFAEQVVIGLAPIETQQEAQALSLPDRVDRFEQTILAQTLREVQGDVRAALRLLSIPRKTFYDKLKRYGIDIDAFRKPPPG
jgi:two-component system, NtrC family, C4-dicarboxylate transport response regulator DctD